MQYTIRIPEPCNAAWSEMRPESNGRHCAQCSKTVVDFTAWEADAIILYLQAQGAATTCGRFSRAQLAPQESDVFVYSVSRSGAPYYSKFVAIFLLAFGLIQLSCNTGEPATTKPQSVGNNVITGAPTGYADTMTKHSAGFIPPVVAGDNSRSSTDGTTHDKVKKKRSKPVVQKSIPDRGDLIQGDTMLEFPSNDTMSR